MVKKLIISGVVVLVLALLLTLAPACGKEKGEIKTLKIGFIGPLSGPAAPWGVSSELGAKWAADNINAAGGIQVGADTYMIEVISCDDKYQAAAGAECATRLAYDEGVHYVIGPITAATADAVDPLFTQYKVLYVVQGFPPPAPEYPYRFNGVTKDSHWTSAWYTQVAKYHPEIKTVCVVTRDDATGRESLANTLDATESVGITVIGEGTYALGTADFYPVLTRLVIKNPDAFDTTSASVPGSVALITKQLRELGYEGWIIQPAATDPVLLLQTGGRSSLSKILSSFPDWSGAGYPERTRALYQEWQQKYAEPGQTAMAITTANSYKAMLFIKQAIEDAGSIDVDKAIKAAEDDNFRFDTFAAENQPLGGLETFGIRHQFPHEVPYGEIIDADHINLSMSVTSINVP